MKTVWAALGLLLALLAGTYALDSAAAGSIEQSALLLKNAEGAAGHGDWPQAQQLTEQARQVWEGHRNFHTFIFWNQTLDAIDISFERLTAHLRTQSPQKAAECFAVLAAELSQASDSYKLCWETVA